MPQTIAIAGGGLLGRLSAWRFLRAGYRVSLFEAGSFSHCAGAAATAAGMISPLAELVDSEPAIYEMGMRSLSLWSQWLAELDDQGLALLHRQGSIVIAHPQDHTELTEFIRRLQFQKAPTADYQKLEQKELQHLEPALQQFQQGLFLKTEAHLDNQRLLSILLNEIIRLGGECIEHCTIDEISSTQMTSTQGIIKADWHIDCRGMGAKKSLPKLRGVRGEVLWVSTAEIQLQRPVRLLHPRYKLYIVPKPQQQFIIGATEIESEDMSAISLQSNLELASALYSLNPAFAEARVIKTDVNLRPALIDNQPEITIRPGHISINGLYRHGYLLAPALIETVLDSFDKH